MQLVLQQAAQRVSCTFDAFSDDLPRAYNELYGRRRQLVRHDAMVKQAGWKQWAVRVTSDPVRSTSSSAIVVGPHRCLSGQVASLAC